MNKYFATASKMSFYPNPTLSGSSSTRGTSVSEDTTKDDDDDDTEDDIESVDEDADEEIFSNHDHNAVKWVIGNEAYCFDVAKFAGKLVDATYIEARKQLYSKQKVYTHLDIVVPILMDVIYRAVHKEYPPPAPVEEVHKSESSISISFSKTSKEAWPKISEFNIKSGLEKVEDYVRTWERLEDWMFCVEFLGFESEDCSNVFVYEVEWSKPTKPYPIPQATASVYFALEVFKMVPFHYDRVIEVTYVFETTNVIHTPGRVDFQEKWLQDIIDSKSMFFKTVTFGTLQWPVR